MRGLLTLVSSVDQKTNFEILPDKVVVENLKVVVATVRKDKKIFGEEKSDGNLSFSFFWIFSSFWIVGIEKLIGGGGEWNIEETLVKFLHRRQLETEI